MEPTEITYDICRNYLRDQKDVDPALISKISGFHRSRNLAELTSCSRYFDWDNHTVNEFRVLRQVEAFFKKNSSFSNKNVCGLAAASTFQKAEKSCGITNMYLDFFYVKRDLLDPDLNSKMSKMERYIRNVLGPYSRFLDDLPCLVRVTPGATSTASRKESLPQLKLKMKLHATRAAHPYLKALYRFYGFNAPRCVEVSTNRVELVPKNWKTDRTIACEPEGNLPLQLAFDRYAKRRLRRVGIDLSNQSANQKLAKEASITGTHVTVDFASASDTISYATVAWLFPADWFKFLCSVRSPRYRGAFGEGSYKKFSSMGNGCTFTLETLIFAAACYAVGARDFLVYGDDVIIEKEYYEAYLRLTRFLGFTINEDKTFVTGPFRESCGFDSFNGIDVTPVYIRSITKQKASLCHLVNTLASIAQPGGYLGRFLLDLVKEKKLPLVPFQLNTLSGVWIYPDDARSLGILRRKYGIDKFRAYTPRSRARNFVDSRGYYLWFLSKNAQALFAGPWDLTRRSYVPSETSSVPMFEHSYVRSWVVWHKPDQAVPVHLYWWTETVMDAA